MTRRLMSGSARPVYIVDPNTRQIIQGSALPVALFDADGIATSFEDYVLIDGTRNIVAAAADFTISDTAENVLSLHRDTNVIWSEAHLVFQLDDVDGNITDYASIRGIIQSNVAGSEDGVLDFVILHDNVEKTVVRNSRFGAAFNPNADASQNFQIVSVADAFLFWADVGNNTVTIGSIEDLGKFGIDGMSDEIQFAIQGHSTQTSDVMIIETSAGTDTLRIDQQAIFDYRGTMANSSKAPQTVAPDDWVEIKIGGTTHFLPAYLA